METLDPFQYSEKFLRPLTVPKIIYRAVGKYTPEELVEFIRKASPTENLAVFVGAASRSQSVTLSLGDAYRLKVEANSDLLLGGVTIPERHQSKGDEHIRVFDKIDQGCRFFVSQGVYDVNASKTCCPNTITTERKTISR